MGVRERPVRKWNSVIDIAGDRGIGGQQPQVLVQAGGARVVVARRDVRIGADPGLLFPDHERGLAVCLQATHTEDDVGADVFELPRPNGGCAPRRTGRSARSRRRPVFPPRPRGSATARTGVSSPTRYTVILIETVSGSSAASRMKRSTAREETVVGMMQQDVSSPDRGEDVSTRCLERQRRQGRPGRVAQADRSRARRSRRASCNRGVRSSRRPPRRRSRTAP